MSATDAPGGAALDLIFRLRMEVSREEKREKRKEKAGFWRA
jgi:hypothetical protein